jgi:pimeloyl-ACP methyl ester carboxylesterase
VLRVAARLDVQFEPCSLYTGLELGESWEENDAGVRAEAPAAECATLQLPLRWSQPEGPTIDWFVKRLPAAERSRGQLWLLEGGPGFPASGVEFVAEDLHRTVPDLDIYMPDHRGVGRSTLFECEEARSRRLGTPLSQLVDCGAEIEQLWGEDTKEFTTTAAARDVLAVANHFHEQGRELIVWGASYGGYLAHRVLQADRHQNVTAAVLDSSSLPIGGSSTLEQTLEVNEAGSNLLGACARDSECKARMGTDPEAHALNILSDLCPELRALPFGERPYFQSMLSDALRAWRLLRLIPAMLYRAERCSQADIDALIAFYGELDDSGREGTPEAPESFALLVHIMFTEMTNELSPAEDILRASEEVVFADLGSSVDLRTALANWPRYAPDEFIGRWAETDVPLLLLHGGLDTQTPPSMGRALAEQYTAPGQQAFFFPTGTHGVYFGSHDYQEGDDRSCGAFLTQEFLRDAHATVDGSCIVEAGPLDFSANEETLIRVFGHTDVWDDPDGRPLP